jgi:hypothetical protein
VESAGFCWPSTFFVRSLVWSGLVVGLGLRIGVRIWIIIEIRINQNNADAVGKIQYERSKKDKMELKR